MTGSLNFLIFKNLIAAMLVVMSSASAEAAGWLTIKNDTNKTIVVQETVTVNGQVKHGKPTNLLPGETLREFVAAPTVKRIEVFDGKNPQQAAWSGNLNCKDEAQTFSVSAHSGRVSVDAVIPSTSK